MELARAHLLVERVLHPLLIQAPMAHGHQMLTFNLVVAELGLEESEWAQTRHDQLNLIEGKRLTAISHGHLYQQRMKNTFDKKVRPCKFHEGDLVLKKVSHNVKDSRGKWAPNYEGPFVVKRAFSKGALVLTNMDGEELPSPVNSDLVKRYYA